jgi:hypothetical protein
MKKFKIFLILLSIILIPCITFLFFLYKQDRLLILYKKSNNKKYSSLLDTEKLSGIFSTETEEKKIPFSITFDTFNKDNPEDFIYSILYQFFHYINLENIGKINYDLYHVALDNKNIIINGSLHQTTLLSPYQEYLFIKSIFITIKNIFPFVERIYFYNDELPLALRFMLPFFTTEMLPSKNQLISPDFQKNELLTEHELLLIPFFEGNGNQIQGIFEKNLFQKYSERYYIPKNKHNSDEYFKEINQYKLNTPLKIILYISIKETKDEHLDIVYYPIIPEKEFVYEIDPYPLPKENKIIEALLYKFKNGFNSVSYYSFPFIPIINTIYPSLYITIGIKNINELENVLNKIKNILLN